MTEKRKIIHALIFPILFLLVMWLNYIVFYFSDANMGIIGIKPLQINGLQGVILSPFAHGSLKHIASNSTSFVVLALFLFYFYRLVAYRVFLLNWFISGLLLWIGGRDSVHIGASGIVYGLAFFLFFSGLLRKDKKLGAISLIVIFLYGSMFWGMLPQGGNISWEGHLFGAITGFTLAWYYRKNPIDFIPVEDGSSISVTWGRYNDFEYEYIEEDSELEENSTRSETPSEEF
ncbi:MAG: rhomboid family intramembrane serine protease [Salinivirgaceae bacterium]|jgi:membrane associated rhomboid family serine protease|nr:rhomboid family intramembrane serine protease [Salinivirgaceae bacterium]